MGLDCNIKHGLESSLFFVKGLGSGSQFSLGVRVTLRQNKRQEAPAAFLHRGCTLRKQDAGASIGGKQKADWINSSSLVF